MVKRTKCTVGKRETRCSFARGHPECRYAGVLRAPERKKMKRIHMRMRENERGGRECRNERSWIGNYMIVMHDLGFKGGMRIKFY